MTVTTAKEEDTLNKEESALDSQEDSFKEENRNTVKFLL